MKKLISIILVIVAIIFYRSDLKHEIYKLKDDLVKKYSSNENANEDIHNNQGDSHNTSDIYNLEKIKLGDSLDLILENLGNPGRIDDSEYGFKWYVYNQYSEVFAMVGIENNIVVALYSNSIDSCESEGIKLNSNRDFVREKYTTLEYKQKGNTRYIINSENQYDIINKDKKYITIFYDIYENNRVCSYQIISEKVEDSISGIYPNSNDDLRKSFELQIIDLTNSVRQKKGLTTLDYNKKATVSSRKHSEDMRDRNFFDHINKNNETPFDRMKKEGIIYTGAGENIAAGQTSAIYAHEAWMNSEGHRKNILGDYKYIGVGVEFGGYYSTYYTQNFYI